MGDRHEVDGGKQISSRAARGYRGATRCYNRRDRRGDGVDKTALVESELELGRTIIHEVESLGIPIDLAAWLQDERLDWRLILSSPALTKIGGTRRVYDAIYTVLERLDDVNLEANDVDVWSPSDPVVRDLKNYVRTSEELQTIKLRDLDLGFKSFRAVVVYRSQGGRNPGRWLERDAHVRARSTGKQGVVHSRAEGPDGARYLVRHFLALKDRISANGTYRAPDEKLYGPGELEFLYAIRPGGRPEKPPLMKQSAREAARTG